jgi:hypothetical protein
VPDPANSIWLVYGAGDRGIAETHGLHMLPDSAEGVLAPVERGGQTVGQSTQPGRGLGYYYMLAAPWNDFRVWQGDSDLLLTLRYWDGSPGGLAVRYDSSDPRVRLDPNSPGTWKAPPDYPEGLRLAGTKTFQTVSMRLPLATFTKRCNGGDFRLDPWPGVTDFALAGVAITRVPHQAEAMQVTQNLRVEKTTGFESFGTGARFAGTFAQKADEPIVMEGELATTLALRDGHTPGADPQASGGGYIHYVASASWRLDVKTPGKYVAWERASFPWAGGWSHTENMDGK